MITLKDFLSTADADSAAALVRIESFRGVSAAGTYDAKVPSEWRNADLFVDDAYGVVGVG